MGSNVRRWSARPPPGGTIRTRTNVLRPPGRATRTSLYRLGPDIPLPDGGIPSGAVNLRSQRFGVLLDQLPNPSLSMSQRRPRSSGPHRRSSSRICGRPIPPRFDQLSAANCTGSHQSAKPSRDLPEADAVSAQGRRHSDRVPIAETEGRRLQGRTTRSLSLLSGAPAVRRLRPPFRRWFSVNLRGDALVRKLNRL